jgi:basic amino acid/polyamine antiporter, APA family
VRALGLLDVTCLGVNAVIGSSVFLFPGQLAALVGPASPLAFGLTAAMLASVAICFARASARFEQAGGAYLYARERFGPSVGFSIGWLSWISQVFSWAAVANAVAVYLGYFDPSWSSPAAVKAVALGAILFFGALNYRGVKMGARASNFFTAAKLIPLGLFILLGLPKAVAAGLPPDSSLPGSNPMGRACFLAYFAFQGFENAPVPAGEVDNPKRNVPLAILLSLALAAAVYMLVQYVAVAVHPGLAASERPLADAAAILLGPWGAGLMVAGAVVSTLGYNSGTALVTPRYLACLAQEGELPRILGAEHPVYKTPAAAVALTTALAAAAAAALDFNKLVDFSNVVICAQYLATCAAVLSWDKKRWLAPVLGMAATCWLGAQGGWAQLGYTALALAVGLITRYTYSLFTNN